MLAHQISLTITGAKQAGWGGGSSEAGKQDAPLSGVFFGFPVVIRPGCQWCEC